MDSKENAFIFSLSVAGTKEQKSSPTTMHPGPALLPARSVNGQGSGGGDLLSNL